MSITTITTIAISLRRRRCPSSIEASPQRNHSCSATYFSLSVLWPTKIQKSTLADSSHSWKITSTYCIGLRVTQSENSSSWEKQWPRSFERTVCSSGLTHMGSSARIPAAKNQKTRANYLSLSTGKLTLNASATNFIKWWSNNWIFSSTQTIKTHSHSWSISKNFPRYLRLSKSTKPLSWRASSKTQNNLTTEF